MHVPTSMYERMVGAGPSSFDRPRGHGALLLRLTRDTCTAFTLLYVTPLIGPPRSPGELKRAEAGRV